MLTDYSFGNRKWYNFVLYIDDDPRMPYILTTMSEVYLNGIKKVMMSNVKKTDISNRGNTFLVCHEKCLMIHLIQFQITSPILRKAGKCRMKSKYVIIETECLNTTFMGRSKTILFYVFQDNRVHIHNV